MTYKPDAGDHILKLLQNENTSFIDSHICQKLAGINPQNNHKSMDIVTLYLPGAPGHAPSSQFTAKDG